VIKKMSLKESLLSGAACLLIAAAPGAALAQASAPDAQDGVLSEIVVTGIRKSIADAISTKRQSTVLMDTISAEDIGKLPDQNVAETLSRIPGVQITRVEGQGAAVSVRGISLNKLQLNGKTFIGTAANGDANLADISPELLAGVDVIKAPSADLVEGWLGAIINLRTKRPLDLSEPIFSARLEGSYGDKAEKLGFKTSAFAATKLLDNQVGVLFGASYSDVYGRSDQYSSGGWTRSTGAADVTADGVKDTFFMPLRLQQIAGIYEDERTAFNSTVQWKPSSYLTFTLDGLLSKRSVNRVLTASQAVLAPALTTAGTILADGTLSKATFNGVTFRPLVYDESSRAKSHAISLATTYARDRWLAHVNLSSSKGTSIGQDALNSVASVGNANVLVTRQLNPTNTMSVNYELGTNKASPNFALNSNYTILDPTQYEVFATFDSNYPIRNKGRDADFDVKYDAEWGVLKAVHVGARTEKISVFSAQAQAVYPPLSTYDPTPANSLRATEVPGLGLGPTVGSFMSGVSGNFPRTLLSGNPDPDVWRAFLHAIPPSLDNVASKGTVNAVDQTTNAVFGKLVFEGELGGLEYSGDVGVRQVNVHRKANGFNLVGATTATPVSVSNDFNSTLPNVNLILRPNDQVSLRFAAAKVTARPPLSSTGVGVTLFPVTNTGTAGNPDLKPYAATQYDASAEWYFAPASMLSVAVFKKDVSAFTRIIQVSENHPEAPNNTTGQTTYLINRPINGTKGAVDGFEINYQQALTFLPEPLDGFGFVLTYTRANSKTPNIDQTTGEHLPLPFASKDSANVIIYYEKGPFSARAAYNYRSKFLVVQQATASGGSLWNDKRGQLDASASYKLSDRYRVTLEATNLTQNINSFFVTNRNRINNAFQDDRRVFFGIAGTF
jgi:TonB-dependent receptor